MVYTHSEEKWAIKVCEAMERMAGWPFIKRVFSRMDCKVGCVYICACVHAKFVCAWLYENKDRPQEYVIDGSCLNDMIDGMEDFLRPLHRGT